MVIITQPYCNVQRMMLSSFKVHGIYATNVNTDAPVLHAATPFTPGVFWFSVLMLDHHHHLHLFLLWPASSSQGSPFAFRDVKNKKCHKVVGRVHEAPPFMRCWQESGNAPGGRATTSTSRLEHVTGPLRGRQRSNDTEWAMTGSVNLWPLDDTECRMLNALRGAWAR